MLDVGRGLGLFLIGAAKRLSTGRAVGIDKWQQEDLSGNNAAGTLDNATIEGVADKVDVHTGDAPALPFDDGSFDVVLSSMALHNIYNAGARHTAVREIARVPTANSSARNGRPRSSPTKDTTPGSTRPSWLTSRASRQSSKRTDWRCASGYRISLNGTRILTLSPPRPAVSSMR